MFLFLFLISIYYKKFGKCDSNEMRSTMTNRKPNHGEFSSDKRRCHNNSHIRRPTTGWYSDSFEHRNIVVDSEHFIHKTGGPEAMVQLSMALATAVCNPEKVSISTNSAQYHISFLQIYGNRLIYNGKDVNSLKPGDVYITTEGKGCGVPPGVHIYIYILSNFIACVDSRNPKVHYLSHNYYLANHTFTNKNKEIGVENTSKYIRLPRERIIRPYLSPPIIEHAMKVSGLESDGSISYYKSNIKFKKMNLVLLDEDVRNEFRTIIESAVKQAGGQILILEVLNNTQIIDAYEKAKVMIDWCMRGSERCPMEASLFGAIVITNKCSSGESFADFPIPDKYLMPGYGESLSTAIIQTDQEKDHLQIRLMNLFTDIFDHYWDHVLVFEPLRRSVLELTPLSMTKDAIRFLSTIHLDELYHQQHFYNLSTNHTTSKSHISGATNGNAIPSTLLMNTPECIGC